MEPRLVYMEKLAVCNVWHIHQARLISQAKVVYILYGKGHIHPKLLMWANLAVLSEGCWGPRPRVHASRGVSGDASGREIDLGDSGLWGEVFLWLMG